MTQDEKINENCINENLHAMISEAPDQDEGVELQASAAEEWKNCAEEWKNCGVFGVQFAEYLYILEYSIEIL